MTFVSSSFFPTHVLVFVIFFSSFVSSSHLYHNQIRHDTDDTLDVFMFFPLLYSLEMNGASP